MNTTRAKLQPDVPFVDLAAQGADIAVDVGRAIKRILRKGDFILGQEFWAFDEEFAAYCER